MDEPRRQPPSRGAVLEAIRVRGTASRAEVAGITGLTPASVTNVVRQLLQEGLVHETGERELTGGKPRIMLRLTASARGAVGVQLGADGIVVTLVDAVGVLRARSRIAGARERDPDEVVARIADVVARLVATAGVDPRTVVGLGVAAPGLLDVRRGTILRSRSLPAWVGHPLAERLRAATGHDVVVDNDATAAAIGQVRGGESADARAHCTVYLGASVGVGVVLDGVVFRGASSNTGAIGLLPVHRPGAGVGRTLEDVVAPRGVAEAARVAIAGGATTTIALSPSGDPYDDFSAVATAAVRGDALGIALLEESAEHLSDAVVAIANVLDLDSVLLAGPAFAVAGTIYLRRMQERLAAGFFAAQRHPLRVGLGAQVSDAASIGAAALVLQREMSPERPTRPLS